MMLKHESYLQLLNGCCTGSLPGRKLCLPVVWVGCQAHYHDTLYFLSFQRLVRGDQKTGQMGWEGEGSGMLQVYAVVRVITFGTY